MKSSPLRASRCFAHLGAATLAPAVLPSSSISSLLALLFLIPPPRSQPLVSVQSSFALVLVPGFEVGGDGAASRSLAPPSGPGPEHRARQPLTGPLAFSPRTWWGVWSGADSWYPLPGQALRLACHCFCPNRSWFLSKSVAVPKTRPGAFACAHSWNTSYEQKQFWIGFKMASKLISNWDFFPPFSPLTLSR